MRYDRIAPLQGAIFEARALADEPGAVAPDTARAPTIALTLVSATRSPSPPQFEAFALTWEGPAAQPLAQGVYALSHPALGREEVFLVPIGRTGAHFIYEAVFCVDATTDAPGAAG